jgi:uncharacterized membrane protein YozB (DUF420 family)
MTVYDLPPINAALNALSTVFIIVGITAIKRDQKPLHIFSMTAAIITSTLFLGCYLTYHAFALITKFAYEGWPKVLYYLILFPHLTLAVAVVPLVIMSVVPALQARYDRHRRIAAWTWPIWLYVSITGVLVYMMLYVWFPSRR